MTALIGGGLRRLISSLTAVSFFGEVRRAAAGDAWPAGSEQRRQGDIMLVMSSASEGRRPAGRLPFCFNRKKEEKGSGLNI